MYVKFKIVLLIDMRYTCGSRDARVEQTETNFIEYT